MTPNELTITIIIFAIILVVSLFAIGLCRMVGHSDCSYSDPDKRIGHDGEEPEWKDEGTTKENGVYKNE